MCVEIKNIIIKLEVYAEDRDKHSNLRSVEQKLHANSKNKRGKIKMSFSLISKSLIRKFLETKISDKYIECTRTKIGKLLVIVQMAYLKATKEMAFNEPIYVDKCGATIPSLAALGIPYDIIEEVAPKLFDSNEEYYVSNSALDINVLDIDETRVPRKYLDENSSVNEKLKQITNDVFLEFGGYESLELGRMIDEFKLDISDNNTLDMQSLSKYIEDNFFNNYENNKIINFIRNY